MTAFDRIKKITDRRGISINELENRVGISQNVLYGWKKKTPGGENLTNVAKYLNISTDYILGIVDNPEPFVEKKTDDLDDVLDNVMSFDGEPLDDHDREVIRAYLKGRFGK